MARGKKTGGRDFKPGNPGGPGYPALPGELKEARALNRHEFEKIINKFIYMNGEELHAAKADPTATMLDLLVISIILKAGHYGDPHRVNFLIERLLGKVPDKIEHSGAIEMEAAARREEARMIASDPEALALAKALRDRINAKRE